VPQFPRLGLDQHLVEIEYEVENLQQLQTLDFLNGEVLNIGCTSTREPVALMKILNTRNVTGINIEIIQAHNSCSDLQLLLDKGKAAYESSYITEDDRLFWQNTVPNFLKEGLLPCLIQENLMNCSHPSNHFDLIYSSGVLKHIDDIKSAIYEMKRVLKLGGWVVIDGIQREKFREIFEEVGLRFGKEKSNRLLEFYEKISL
jgi:SAM-dependent methyltransferase